MDPAVIGARLASSVVAPLVRRLFVQEGPGAGLVDKPIRISSLLSFTGEKRTLTEKDLHKLAARLVRQAVDTAGPGERPCPADEDEAVAGALARTLHCLGDLDMDDVQAVRLGSHALALLLIDAAIDQGADLYLSAAGTRLHQRLLDTACLHILHFFSQRSAFIPRTLVAQSNQLGELVTKLDLLIARLPSQSAEDAGFERRYAEYIAKRHGTLTIYGIDVSQAEASWPLDAAYLTLAAIPREEDGIGSGAGAAEPAERALAGHHRVLLRGVAGSGKTTLVQWLAVSTARQQPLTGMEQLIGRVPFVLPLRTIARQDALPTPDRLLAAVHNPLHGAQPTGWADRVLSAGRGVLLIDGMDEIPAADRERTRAWLDDLLIAYPRNLWLVTSRPSAVADDWLAAQGFTEFALAPMSRDDVAAFIDRWHDAARATCRGEETRATLDTYQAALRTAVTTKPDLGRLATTPLMCGLLCALHRARRGYLPPGRKALYDAALSMLLTRRDTERRIYAPGDPQLDEEPQIQLLQRLAYWLIRNGQAEMDRHQAERVLTPLLPALPAVQALGGAGHVLDHLLLRSGLLREPTPGTVDFVHRTFQDYLGAKAAVEDGDFGLLVNHATDSQWEDVIRMAVAHARPRERANLLHQLLKRCDDDPDTDINVRCALLAAACLEHAPDLDPAVRERVQRYAAHFIPPDSLRLARLVAQTVGPLALELLPPPRQVWDDHEVSEYCTVTATRVGTEAAIPYLREFADHPALPVRTQLSHCWSDFDTHRYYTEVISRLSPDDLYFTADSTEELHLLLRSGRRMLMLRGGEFLAADIRSLPPEQLTHLRLDCNAVIDDLTHLDHLRGLTALALTRCLRITDLAPLAPLGLHSLDWSPPAPYDPPLGLEKLTTLRQLRLALLGPGIPQVHLPEVSRLELDIHHASLDVAAVADSFPGLRHARITFRDTWPRPLDLAPLARLNGLESLCLERARQISGAELLPSVTITTREHPQRLTGLPTWPANSP
ncbi:NACHT domain-containing protein [Streptomyces palmae]|uniref:NACHT domain-containing protein n=1 Tax=Streptomyces palmae TaxID=1701085 RepID=A0A4Z0HCG7_9ACTN|nr:NACHT domain-containing protein [Streptomyces palmae]TGB11182.1 NACHT domain-containing protein [Streptomyces palmae]